MRQFLFSILLVSSAMSAQSLHPEHTLALPPNVTVASTAIARAGNYLAARCSDRQVRVWQLASGQLLSPSFSLGSVPLVQIAISRDGTLLAAGTRAGGVRVWELTSGKVRLEANADGSPETMSFSPDDRLLAVGPVDMPVEVWDLSTQRKIAMMRPAFGGVNALAFSDDSKWLASADGTTEIRVYDARSGALRSMHADLLLEPFAVQFTPDGKSLLAGGADKEISVIDPATGKLVRKFQKMADPIIGLLVSPDGTRATAACVNEKSFAMPAPFAVWNLQRSSLVTKLPQPDDVANGGEYLEDGRLLMTSTARNELHVWSLR
jgi:WD40 repeat protein